MANATGPWSKPTKTAFDGIIGLRDEIIRLVEALEQIANPPSMPADENNHATTAWRHAALRAERIAREALSPNAPHEGPSGASREGPLDAVVGRK